MICTEYDQWLKDQDKTVWMVKLKCPWCNQDSHIEMVYQDDGRSSEKESSAWKRLRLFLEHPNGTNISIVGFGLGFRDHAEWLPVEYPDGIYFSKGVIADMLNPHPCNCYVLGWIKDGLLTKVWYRIPEVIEYQREETRDFNSESPAIIWSK